MREILFKGFYECEDGNTVITVNGEKKRGEWVEGDLSHTKRGQSFISVNLLETGYDVIPSTVCQCTGLTDENGKRIFENDLVCTQFIDPIFKSTFSENIDYEESHEVKFDNGCFYAEIKEKANLTLYAFKNKIEVIGNIFENPELLEDKTE